MAAVNSLVLLSGTTTGDGAAGVVDASEYQVPYSVIIKGIAAGDTVTLFVSNDAIQPANSAAMTAFAAAISANGPVTIPATFKWILANRTANAGAGTVVATLAASNRK